MIPASGSELNRIGVWERARQPAGISVARQGEMSGFLLGERYSSERSERGNISKIIRIYMIIPTRVVWMKLEKADS